MKSKLSEKVKPLKKQPPVAKKLQDVIDAATAYLQAVRNPDATKAMKSDLEIETMDCIDDLLRYLERKER